MKKIAFLLTVVICLSLCSCGGNASKPNNSPDVPPQGTETNPQPTLTPEIPNDVMEPDDDSNLIRPEIIDFLDSYEAFMDSYIDFMKGYMSADLTEKMQMMTRYTELLTQYTDYMEKVEKLDNSDMNEAEILYYLEVTSRVTKKLTENLL